MKTLFTTVALTGGLLMAAVGSASAMTQAECEAYARAQTDRVYPLGRGVVTGGALGGLLGLGIGAASGNAGKGAAIGAGVGGAGGIAVYQTRRQNYFNAVLADCLRGVGPAPQPVYAPPPAAPAPPPPYWARITGSGLNVRNAPSTSGTAVLFTLHAYDLFQILQCEVPTNSGWCWIDYNGANGWVARSYTIPAS